jgi:hypothetical protein
MTFLDLAYEVLKQANRPLTPAEIWQEAVNQGLDKQVGSEGKTPWRTLAALLYIDVRDNPNTPFVSVGARPKRFTLKTSGAIHAIANSLPSQSLTPHPSIKESDLHPLMVYYGYKYLKIHMKTINHNRSKKRGLNEWLHPDIVGCYFPFVDWEKEVVELSKLMGNTLIKVYSFELKREITLSNLREAFFQAVSNSSWANEGYLAAAYIDPDEEFISELNRLSTSFGIGIIRLDVEDPDSSQVLIPARYRETLDWDTVNKIAAVNSEFRDFLRSIQNAMTIHKVNREEYDPVKDIDSLKTSLSSKK